MASFQPLSGELRSQLEIALRSVRDIAEPGASAALALSATLPKDQNNERATVFVVVGVTSLSTLAMIVYPLISAQFGPPRSVGVDMIYEF